jgi:nicotinamide-nucleotide amidase
LSRKGVVTYMNGEIICVGTELLLGDIVNTNAQYLSRELAALGINLFHQTVVGDNPARLKEAVGEALGRSDLVLLTGGLGPTGDDLTKETVADLLGLSLVEDGESLRRMEAYFRRGGRKMTENNRKQALVPQGAEVFQNDNGTAPGIAISSGNQTIILLPGPPDEMRPMFETQVRPYLAGKSGAAIVSHSVRLFGIGEAAAAEALSDLFESENPTVAPYAKTGEVEIRVTASGRDQAAADHLCRPMVEKVTARMGGYVYGVDTENLQQAVIALLQEQKKKIATAESCTAGLLSKKLTEVSGSSAVFDMGIVAYANAVKTNALGVPAEVIAEHGAVSPQTAAGMALGVREISGADIGVSVTGVAGPAASEEKPVGLVYIALCDGTAVWVERLMLGRGRSDEREKIREVAAKSVLDLARRYLCGGLPKKESVPTVNLYSAGIFDHLLPTAAELAVFSGAAAVRADAEKTAAEQTGASGEGEKNVQELYSGFSPASAADPDANANVPARTGALTPEEIGQNVPFPGDDADAVSLSDLAGRKAALPDEKQPPLPPAKKKPWYKRFLCFLFPCKGDRPGEVVRKLIFLVALIALIGSGIYIANYYINGYFQRQQLTNVQGLYKVVADNNEVGENGIYKKFDALLAMNSDTIGWLSIADTNIDNPVFHNTDKGTTEQEKNNYYVNHNMYRENNMYGALFLDSSSTFSRDTVSQNQVIYGHNMNDGTMFNNLRKYRDLAFTKEHMRIDYDTLYDLGEYKIFAVIITNTESKHDGGFIFNYRIPDFSTQSEFLRWIENCKARSIYNTPVDVQPYDEILTLSTCIYDFDNARLVVMARKVRDGESSEVDSSAVVLNPSPLYPQAWYDKKGGSKPSLDIDTEEFNTTADAAAQNAAASKAAAATSSKRTGTAGQTGSTSRTASTVAGAASRTTSTVAIMSSETSAGSGADVDTGGSTADAEPDIE